MNLTKEQIKQYDITHMINAIITIVTEQEFLMIRKVEQGRSNNKFII